MKTIKQLLRPERLRCTFSWLRESKSLISGSVERVDAGTVPVHKAGRTVDEVVTAIRRVTEIVAEISPARWTR